MRRAILSCSMAGLALAAIGLVVYSCAPADETDVAVASLVPTPGVRNGAVKGDTSVIVRRVWEGIQPSFWASEPSPDGRYLTDAYFYVNTGDLSVIDLVTGERERVTRMKDWNTYAESAVYSPDGKKIAYVNFDGTGCPPPGACNYEIRVTDVDGSNDRLLMPGDSDFYAILSGWHGDDIMVMLTNSEAGVSHRFLGFVSAIDGSFRPFLDFDSGYWSWAIEGEADLSPDGRVAAYDVRSAWGEDSDIVLLSTVDGSELGRIDGPSDDRTFGFSPDGAGLLFGSDRDLTEGIWSQPLRNGRPEGDPVLLRGDIWRAVPIGTSNDALFFGVTTQAPTVRIASFDPETGALLSEPSAVESPSAARAQAPVWSPDGRHLAYFRSGDPQMIVIRSMAGDDVREIPVPSRLANLLLWTESGTILASDRNPETGAPTLFEVNLETGVVRSAWEVSNKYGGRYGVAMGSDGPILFLRRGVSNDWTLVAHDLETGNERDLVAHAGDEIDAVAASPDGSVIALMLSGETIVTVPGQGGAMRVVHHGQFSNHAGITWTPDSRYFYFLSWEGEEPPVYTLWKGDAQTGEAVQVSETDAAIGWAQAVVHPDGNRIAFVSGEARAEIWMMTNLPGSR